MKGELCLRSVRELIVKGECVLVKKFLDILAAKPPQVRVTPDSTVQVVSKRDHPRCLGASYPFAPQNDFFLSVYFFFRSLQVPCYRHAPGRMGVGSLHNGGPPQGVSQGKSYPAHSRSTCG